MYLLVNRCTFSVVAAVAHGLPVVHHIKQCGVNAHRYCMINDCGCPVADAAQWILFQVSSACIPPLSAIVSVVFVASALVCRSGFASWKIWHQIRGCSSNSKRFMPFQMLSRIVRCISATWCRLCTDSMRGISPSVCDHSTQTVRTSCICWLFWCYPVKVFSNSGATAALA